MMPIEPLGGSSTISLLPIAFALCVFPWPELLACHLAFWVSQELFTSDNSVHLAIATHGQGQQSSPKPQGWLMLSTHYCRSPD